MKYFAHLAGFFIFGNCLETKVGLLLFAHCMSLRYSNWSYVFREDRGTGLSLLALRLLAADFRRADFALYAGHFQSADVFHP